MSATAIHADAGAADHGDHHGPIEIPDDPQYGVASPGKIAMWIFLLSDGFSFSGLLLAYGILRGGAKAWPPNPELGEPHLGINFTAGLTFLLICSSVTMVLAHAAAVEGNRKKLVGFLSLTILGGILFLCGQMQEYFGAFHALWRFFNSTAVTMRLSWRFSASIVIASPFLISAIAPPV